ncbi:MULTISPECIES: hypothetical protein [Gordonibacter]|uniref:hypothetical protein n=1 Tax=Gordonibacter TaxID=644652 RepID=UPI000F4CC4A3|nr:MULTISPECIES: hypothetical protein [Gordonibacter]MDN4510295.1 hypothetical protein [Gordonibacter sp. RACS_AR49]ROT87967.1 hypothetical protein DMP13_14060 [Gordonibacter urolithinfaciens]
MAADMNLPRLNDLSKLLLTSDDLGRAKEAEFVKGIREDKVKMLVTDNQITCVMLAPEVYSAFLEVTDKVMKPAAQA